MELVVLDTNIWLSCKAKDQHMFDVLVIGLGLIGSAALRALSESGPDLRVAGVGPAEPSRWNRHDGAFASHYDQARITRVTDPDQIWATLASRAINNYAEIEAWSGIKFHYPSGHLRLGHASGDVTLAESERLGLELNAAVERLDADALTARFPYLAFAQDVVGLYEAGGAGWINPRALVEAQLTIAASQSAQIIRDEVSYLQYDGQGYTLQTRGGLQLRAVRLLVCAHSYSGALLRPYLGRRLDQLNLAYSTVYAELSEAQALSMADMPSLIWPLQDHPLLPSVYTTPPTRFADGRWRLKIGGPMHEPVVLHSTDEMRAWFHTTGNPEEIEALAGSLQAIVPDLDALNWNSKPCVVSYTTHDHPYIAQVDDDLFVCTGGCGAAAKSSDAVGRLGAALARDGVWSDPLPESAFRVAYS
jgi:sarcosine oxidase